MSVSHDSYKDSSSVLTTPDALCWLGRLLQSSGFESNKGVVVIAATNRADILDQARVFF